MDKPGDARGASRFVLTSERVTDCDEKTILIVMDDPEVSQLIQISLERYSLEVNCAETLSKALEYAIRRSYCLLIIDLQISHIGSAELVRIFRAAKYTPILALSEYVEAQEKLDLFHTGVDAFLEKPINAEVCAAQANTLIKLYLESDEELAKYIPITFGTSMVIAPRYRQVLVQGLPLELLRIEFDILYFMAKHPGQVFSRKELYDYVWDDYYELGGGETVKSHINHHADSIAVGMVINMDLHHLKLFS